MRHNRVSVRMSNEAEGAKKINLRIIVARGCDWSCRHHLLTALVFVFSTTSLQVECRNEGLSVPLREKAARVRLAQSNNFRRSNEEGCLFGRRSSNWTLVRHSGKGKISLESRKSDSRLKLWYKPDALSISERIQSTAVHTAIYSLCFAFTFV